MIDDKQISLILYEQAVEAKIVTLTAELADSKVMGEWWEEDCLMKPLEPPPIDRHWNWNTVQIEYNGGILESEKVAAVTGDGDDLAVQGAMMISHEPIESMAGEPCLLVELLFTAPRNRPMLRKDNAQFVVGVGTQLLIWAAWFSRERGFNGRLRLDGSPDFVRWYEKRGLKALRLDPIVFEGVTYTPMELFESDAQRLLSDWDN